MIIPMKGFENPVSLTLHGKKKKMPALLKGEWRNTAVECVITESQYMNRAGKEI